MMPRQPGGISKVARIDALRQIFRRWGRLNKIQIDQHMSAFLSCPAEEIARTLYRDLEELVSGNELRAVHFTRDGMEITEFDPGEHKNSFCEWIWLEKETRVLGGSILEELGASLLLQPRLQRAFSLGRIDTPPAESAICLYSFFDSTSFCLRIEEEALPVILVAGRNSSRIEPQALLKAIEDSLGKRSGAILYPTQTLSSGKIPVSLGHFCLTLMPGDEIRVRDLGSKNGTRAHSISSEEAHRSLLFERHRMNATVSHVEDRSTQDSTILATHVEIRTEKILKRPAWIEVSLRFRMLII